MQNHLGLFEHLRQATWSTKRPLVTFKIFEHDLFEMDTTAPKFFIDMEKSSPGKYMVVWRRRVIEPYASHIIASQFDLWTSFDKAKEGISERPMNVTINSKDLEKYIFRIQNYYKSVRYILDKKDVDCEVIEYSRDLLEPEQQNETTQRMANPLDLNVSVTEEFLAKYELVKKQSHKTLSEQVENWDEVLKLGYGAEVDGWLDIFEGKKNVKKEETLST